MFRSVRSLISWNLPGWGVSSSWMIGMGAGMAGGLLWRVEETVWAITGAISILCKLERVAQLFVEPNAIAPRAIETCQVRTERLSF